MTNSGSGTFDLWQQSSALDARLLQRIACVGQANHTSRAKGRVYRSVGDYSSRYLRRFIGHRASAVVVTHNSSINLSAEGQLYTHLNQASWVLLQQEERWQPCGFVQCINAIIPAQASVSESRSSSNTVMDVVVVHGCRARLSAVKLKRNARDCNLRYVPWLCASVDVYSGCN